MTIIKALTPFLLLVAGVAAASDAAVTMGFHSSAHTPAPTGACAAWRSGYRLELPTCNIISAMPPPKPLLFTLWWFSCGPLSRTRAWARKPLSILPRDPACAYGVGQANNWTTYPPDLEDILNRAALSRISACLYYELYHGALTGARRDAHPCSCTRGRDSNCLWPYASGGAVRNSRATFKTTHSRLWRGNSLFSIALRDRKQQHAVSAYKADSAYAASACARAWRGIPARRCRGTLKACGSFTARHLLHSLLRAVLKRGRHTILNATRGRSMPPSAALGLRLTTQPTSSNVHALDAVYYLIVNGRAPAYYNCYCIQRMPVY